MNPVRKKDGKGNTFILRGMGLGGWANNMYVILDLHATPGGQGNDLPISDRDPAKPSYGRVMPTSKK